MSCRASLQYIRNDLNSVIKQIKEMAEGGNYTPQGLENQVKEINAEFQETAEKISKEVCRLSVKLKNIFKTEIRAIQ